MKAFVIKGCESIYNTIIINNNCVINSLIIIQKLAVYIIRINFLAIHLLITGI